MIEALNILLKKAILTHFIFHCSFHNFFSNFVKISHILQDFIYVVHFNWYSVKYFKVKKNFFKFSINKNDFFGGKERLAPILHMND